MLTVVQTIAIVAATLTSAYAVAESEVDRRRAERRAGVERLLGAVLQLAEAAAHAQEESAEGCRWMSLGAGFAPSCAFWA